MEVVKINEEDRLIDLVCERFSLAKDQLACDDGLDKLVLDSLELLELVIAIETEFDITIDERRFSHCTTLREIADELLEQISVI